MNPHIQDFFKLIRSSFRYRLFTLMKLPAAFIAGVMVREVDENKCRVTVPFKWLTQNPFRSTYFACLSMAAEMSTGILAMAQIYKRKPSVSMLVVKVESEYFKKASGRTQFICEDGAKFTEAVEESIRTGEARTVQARSIGTNANGEQVAAFTITWSFKAKPTT